jgi:hypothetical protein
MKPVRNDRLVQLGDLERVAKQLRILLAERLHETREHAVEGVHGQPSGMRSGAEPVK